MKTPLFYSILVLFLFNICPSENLAQCNYSRSDDSISLRQFYTATNGPSTWSTKWDMTQPMTTWFGVTLGANGRVTRLELRFNELSGKIPKELTYLCDLTILNLSDNKLTDTLPASMSQMENLTVVNLSNNTNLTKQIPKFNAISLQKLNLSLCDFRGVFPDLSNCYYLIELDISSNKIGGPIPPSYYNNRSTLQIFNASSNQLTDTISRFIASSSSLKELNLSNNLLTGTIPNGIMSLTNLTELCLSTNKLSGNLPPFWGSLTQLQRLSLDSNSFTGNIPLRLDSLKKLEVLQLHINKFSSIVPTTLGALPELRVLNLSKNQLTGSIPTSIGSDTLLQEINISYNKLTGLVPTAFNNLKKLAFFNADSNRLTGTVPFQFSTFPDLAYFNISNNRFDSLPSFSAGFPKYLSSDYNPRGFLFSKNAFTFDDILPNMPLKSKAGFLYDYSGQDSILCISTSNSLKIGEKFTFNIPIDYGVKTNEYQWFKDGKLINKTSVNSLTLNDLQPCQSGDYSCKITNPLVPGMTLYCNDQKLVISEPFKSCEPYELKVFPNPVENVLNLTLISPPEDVRLLKMCNMLGQEIYSSRFDEGTIAQGLTLDCSQFPNGSYFLSLYTEGGNLSLTKRVQVLKK
jgi:Leucine-rich repeat (LRR) protein